MKKITGKHVMILLGVAVAAYAVYYFVFRKKKDATLTAPAQPDIVDVKTYGGAATALEAVLGPTVQPATVPQPVAPVLPGPVAPTLPGPVVPAPVTPVAPVVSPVAPVAPVGAPVSSPVSQVFATVGASFTAQSPTPPLVGTSTSGLIQSKIGPNSGALTPAIKSTGIIKKAY